MNRKVSNSVRHGQRGFSLLELMIAVFVLAVGLIAAASMQGTAMKSDSYAYRNTTITTIAQQVMDDYLSVPIIYSQPPSGWYLFFTTACVSQPYTRFPPYSGPASAPVNQYVVPGLGMFTATYTIQPNTPTTNISRIIVQVQMTTPGGAVSAPFTLVGHREIPTT